MTYREVPVAMLDVNQILTPNGAIRKATKFYSTSSTAITDALGLLPCGVTVSGQLIRGWKDAKTGRFIPDADNPGLRFLVSRGLIEKDWEDAAETIISIDAKARKQIAAKVAADHDVGDCSPPPCPPESDPKAWAETVAKTWAHRTLDTPDDVRAVVHGVDTPDGFLVDPACPNASLWVQ